MEVSLVGNMEMIGAEKARGWFDKGRFDQQGRGVSPLMGHALQNQTHPSAMPQGGTPPSWGRIQRQSKSDLGRVMTDAAPQMRQPVSNYGYSPLQRDDKRCQYEDPSHYSDSETHPPRLQGSYSTSCGLRQSPKQTGCTLQSGQPLSLLQQDQPVQQPGAATTVTATRSPSNQARLQPVQQPVAASQQRQSLQQRLSPNQASLQHQPEQQVPSLQQQQSLRQRSPPNQPRLTHVQQPVAASQQNQSLQQRSPSNQARLQPVQQPVAASQQHQQQQPLQQQSLSHQQPSLSHQQQSLSHQQQHGTMNGNSGDSCREESAFVQLKKQEKMIEQLQEQIKYLLQLQTGSISSGMMTPPATPPSPMCIQSFLSHLHNSSAGKEMGSMDNNHPKLVVGHLSGPESLLRSRWPLSQLTPARVCFFLNPRYDTPTPGRRGGNLSPNSGSPNSREEDTVPNTASRDSSIPGSVSDTAVSTDPDFQVELENVHDDTNSLGKVEIRSFPDSGSAKSSPQR
ncbi:hypothetical protein BSL78_03466 [Apostichopus japonicus]|uniref:Uncharacterized protein n=1 Tax=Stichopus japonicus TaxID=307972 RepID=A0A2G8LH98_STIJA|nr:hypothetical protein BSL78_03466 [Apostichopus japonicus]